jgi:cyclophilin family peptidyl-prolyl cis-trans isomerase
MLSLLFAGLIVTAAAEKAEVKLGEPVVLKVTLKNAGTAPVEAVMPGLDKRSLTLTVGDGADQFVYQRKLDEAPPSKTLAAGEEVSTKVEFTPLKAGKLPIEVVWAGKASAEVEVNVAPAPNGARELGVVLETTRGNMTVRLLPEVAPNTAAHFADRARVGFYDGLKFHRIIKGFMAQGGDPAGNGSGGPGYTLPKEFSKDPRFSHTFGRLSMARTPDPDSAGSQFFICFDGARQLDGQYTVFGEVVDGLEVVKRLEALGQERGDPRNGVPPKEEVKIVRAYVVPLASRS